MKFFFFLNVNPSQLQIGYIYNVCLSENNYIANISTGPEYCSAVIFPPRRYEFPNEP